VKNSRKSDLYVIKQISIPKDFDKQNFEELMKGWKAVSERSSFIIKYLNHWYSEKHVYVLMKYYRNGDLAQKISKRPSENKKFTEKVMIFYIYCDLT
jgi:serine/threonine protein kinase